MIRKQDRKRDLLIAALIVAAALLLYALLACINLYTGKVVCQRSEAALETMDGEMSLLAGEWRCYPGAPMPNELEHAPSHLADVMRIGTMEGKTYRLILRGDALSGLHFMLPRSRGSQIWIDGSPVHSPQGAISSQNVFQFADYLDLSRSDHEFVLRVPVSGYFYSGYQGVVLGGCEALQSIDRIRYFIEVSCLGVYITLVLVCLMLFLQKTSEKYIVTLGFFTLITAYRFLNYSEHFSQYPVFLIGADFFRLFFFIRYMLCRVFVPMRKEQKREATDFVMLVMAAVSCASYLLAPDHFVWLSTDFNLIALVLEALLIARGVMEGVQGGRILLTGFSIYAGMEIFYRLLHLGVIPQGMVDVLIRPTQYAHMAYLIAFSAAVLGKFAGKFSEAEEMAVSLEQKVLEQTRELREKNERIIKEQNQRQQFLTDIVHNLRNPLFALGGYMELLQSRMAAPSDEQQQYLELIEDKLAYLNRMVDDMLLFNRLENGKIRFHFVRLDLGAFMKDVIAGNKLLERCTNIEMQCPPLLIEADGFRLHQALDNLLDNAVLHGACTALRITAEDMTSDILLTIEDNGKGMTPDQLQHAFDRYYTTGVKNSTGLGLSISAAIIRGHHGDIRIASEAGSGTQVRILLPKAAQQHAA